MIALLDYGSGNLRSVQKALQKVGAQVRLVQSGKDMAGAAAAVLPGVGAFDDCVHALQRQELWDATKTFIQSGRPFLGICVGYQALFERSDEFNSRARGLEVFRGNVARFTSQPGLKIPQIGWNQVELARPGCPLFHGLPNQSYFYFVHSFFPRPENPSIVAGWTHYGETFASAIWRDNVFATQFHPEKSQAAGLRLLSNFVAIASAGKSASPPLAAAGT